MTFSAGTKVNVNFDNGGELLDVVLASQFDTHRAYFFIDGSNHPYEVRRVIRIKEVN